jgi:hypothetical protein
MPTTEWARANPEKMREARNKWYKNNSKRAYDKVAQRRAELREWLWNLKATLKCGICGEDETCCLEFHHTDPSEKEVTIALTVSRGFSKERILKEIEKCETLCANCHRKRHEGLV